MVGFMVLLLRLVVFASHDWSDQPPRLTPNVPVRLSQMALAFGAAILALGVAMAGAAAAVALILKQIL